MRLRQIREARRVSQLQVAARANVSIPLVRLFEASDGAGVTDPDKREALNGVYAGFAPVTDSPPPQAA